MKEILIEIKKEPRYRSVLFNINFDVVFMKYKEFDSILEQYMSEKYTELELKFFKKELKELLIEDLHLKKYNQNIYNLNLLRDLIEIYNFIPDEIKNEVKAEIAEEVL